MGFYMSLQFCSIDQCAFMQEHAAFITTPLQYNSKSEMVIPPSSGFIVQDSFDYLEYLCFHTNFKLKKPMKKVLEF